ncbi:FmdB family zinc ribbon protein [Desulfurobacterium sp.]
MPVYEFKCEDCGKEFEKFVISASKVSEVKCPYCGSHNVKKRISACGIGGNSSSSSSTGATCSPFG